jgi:hypothetical protein
MKSAGPSEPFASAEFLFGFCRCQMERSAKDRFMSARLSAIRTVAPDLIASAELAIDTRGEGFTDITREAARFVTECGAGDGVLLLYLRHTSASLTIQENADPDVQTDLATALRRLAPDNAG